MEYKAVYKCRLCGERYYNGQCAGTEIAEMVLLEMNVGIRGVIQNAPQKTDTHHCGGKYTGSLGLADFQGWKRTGEN